MQTPLAISASVLALLLWLLTRRRPFGAGADVLVAPPQSSGLVVRSSVAAVVETSRALASPQGVAMGCCAPSLSRPQLLLGLSSQLKGTPEQRLLAVAQLAGWRDRAVLPLLHRALRDPHPPVAEAAAAAIASYRGWSTPGDRVPPGRAASRQRLPRNAAPRP